MFVRSFVGREVCSDSSGTIIYSEPVAWYSRSLCRPRPRVFARKKWEEQQEALNKELAALRQLYALNIPPDLRLAVSRRLAALECALQ